MYIHARKRKADKIAAKGKSGDVTSGTAIASSFSTLSALGKPTIKDMRAIAARGRIILNKGRGGHSTCS